MERFEPQVDDIQGLVASGYGHLPHSAYLFLQVLDEVSAKEWLAARIPNITTAARKHPYSNLNVNVAFTHKGLRRLGLDPGDLSRFPVPFCEGMVTEHRARVLGDTEDSLRQWDWGTCRTFEPELLMLIYSVDKAILDNEVQQALAGDCGMKILLRLEAKRRSDGKENFGFADGIAQPVLEGFKRQYLKQLESGGRAVSLKPGEVLLGYANEFGMITEQQNTFGRNGTYLVFRQMEQHVDEFWKYFRSAGAECGQTGEALAAKAVGRWPGGAPLVLAPSEDNPMLTSTDDFSYASSDPDGIRCPIGAHIRRANPRDSSDHNVEESTKRARRRSLLRRARSYGSPGGDVECGLHFICLCGDLERQFEFVQQSWVNNPSFKGLEGETDPLTGTRTGATGGHFTIQNGPFRLRLTKMPQFVTVRGGGYFFMPGIAALRKLAET